ncbi:hypothetical protein KY346_05065 [Candidatus Woesearchaeota archaeon]|nr:hypothetical protein [Candidatus Woesearchaeota archaeon]
MKKATILGIVGLLLVGVIAVGAFAMPFGKEGRRGMFDDAAKEALEAGDYDAFVNAVADSEMHKAELTEEQFNQMVERQKEMEEKRAAVQEQQDAVHAALDAGDYAAWKEAISNLEHNSELAEKITEDNFDTFVKMHNKLEEAKELAEELGLERPGLGMNQKGPGGRRGMGRMGHGMDSFEHRMPPIE